MLSKVKFSVCAFVCLLLTSCQSDTVDLFDNLDDALLINNKAIMLRGEMNNYQALPFYVLRQTKENKNRYCTLTYIKKEYSPYRFKFADKDFSPETSLGYAYPPGVFRRGSGTVELKTNSSLEDIRFITEDSGTYNFCVTTKNGRYYAEIFATDIPGEKFIKNIETQKKAFLEYQKKHLNDEE